MHGTEVDLKLGLVIIVMGLLISGSFIAVAIFLSR